MGTDLLNLEESIYSRRKELDMVDVHITSFIDAFFAKNHAMLDKVRPH